MCYISRWFLTLFFETIRTTLWRLLCANSLQSSSQLYWAPCCDLRYSLGALGVNYRINSTAAGIQSKTNATTDAWHWIVSKIKQIEPILQWKLTCSAWRSNIPTTRTLSKAPEPVTTGSWILYKAALPRSSRWGAYNDRRRRIIHSGWPNVSGWVLPSFTWVSSFQSQVQAPSGASHTHNEQKKNTSIVAPMCTTQYNR